MTTTTESLVERAGLNPKERGRHLHSIRSGGAVFSPSLEPAATAKALWAEVERIEEREKGYREDSEKTHNQFGNEVSLEHRNQCKAVALAFARFRHELELELEAAGMERPE